MHSFCLSYLFDFGILLAFNLEDGYYDKGVNMRNENVEYNEVRCKNLIIGDEETGYINLKVNQIDDSPCLEIQSNDGNEDSSITIGYKDGTPIISLITNRTDEKKHIIKLSFDENYMPIMELGIQDDEEKYDNVIGIGLTDKGTPSLALSSDLDQDTSVVAGLSINEKGQAYLVLNNESVKGGSITVGVDDDGGVITIRTNQEPTDETESQKSREGILLVNNSEVTLMDIKGQKIGSRNLKKRKHLPRR